MLIFNRLAERGILDLDNVFLDEFKGLRLYEIFPKGISLAEGIRMEEFGPEHFDLTYFTKFVEPNHSKFHVMRNHEYNTRLKATIFTTLKPPISWIRDRTEDISQLQQVTKLLIIR